MKSSLDSSAHSEKSMWLKSPRWRVPECVVVQDWSIWSGSVVLAAGRLRSSMRTALGSLKHHKRYLSYLAKRSTWSQKMCFLSRAQFTKLLAIAVNMPFCKLGEERYLEPLNSKINHCRMAWLKICIIDNNCYYNLVFIWSYHKGRVNNDNNWQQFLN